MFEARLVSARVNRLSLEVQFRVLAVGMCVFQFRSMGSAAGVARVVPMVHYALGVAAK